ncbi:MAG: LD-carboxypeptidase [Bacteroidota bacterium]|nr:LD-carboxypeptidase [Bacteroidota bacterium]MDP4193834.1 LD-carboxypeptidase [Bacteroidota bacterium]
MEVIKPPKLNKGDLIGIISPASSPDDLTRIEKGVNYLERLGYQVEVGKNVGQNCGYLAGKDEQRLEDLHYMFSKPEIKAILCVRGGYGSPRLLNLIDYNLIKKNPKIFVGYSDITALQMAFLKKAGLVTFAGPMLAVDFWNEISPFTEQMFWDVISSKKKFGKVTNPENERFYILKNGETEAQVIGGNMALICSIMGTNYMPSFKDTILMLEEIGEAPYRVDRMFNQLKLAGALDQIKGIILGRFVDCYESDEYKKTLTLNEVIDDYMGKLEIPVVYNFKHGHVKDNITVAFGLNYKINTQKGTIEMTESAVS